MQTLAVEFLDQGFHRVLFNSMPMPVFVVDRDVSILEYNTAAAELVGEDKNEVFGHRGGDILHCLRARETPGGCGTSPKCSTCVIRKAVRSALQGRPVMRQWANMELLKVRKSSKVKLRVTAQPVKYERQSFVLLILEGLND
jgi:PAS domain-containing protein